jgi:predicted ATPase/DNA-binding winged helix-turn-helix (wHTH) protein
VLPQAVVNEGTVIAFGPFRVARSLRRVFEGAEPIRLGGRAFDILLALVDRPGQTLSNEELISLAWPETAVDSANLRVQVRALRRALGDGHAGARYIVNVPLRGYCFVAPVSRDAAALPSREVISDAEAADAPDLPLPLGRLVGRADAVLALAAQVRTRRSVTIVGPAGTGKSAIALAVAERVASGYADGVRFVDLAPLADPTLVPSAIATALGIPLAAPEQLPALVRAVADRELLLVLDNCEHLVGAVAQLAEVVLRGAPRVALLSTSREALRVPGEWVSRLPCLPFPPPEPPPTAAEALEFPAVELFVERAAASFDGFVLTDDDAPIVAELCRKLDGIPLAIELAAARLDSSSVKELAARLDDRFRFLMRGRRTALPRQQTLRGAMDWSYGTLSSDQQRALRLLATFPGGFDVDGAATMTAESGGRAVAALSEVADLIEKSLITADVRGDKVQYRLLATTRAYALEKLFEAEEHDEARRRHALYTRGVLEQMEASSDQTTPARWFAEHPSVIDDIRAVMTWAFSSQGDPALGVAVAAASVRCASLLSLHAEFRGYMAQALQVPDLAATDPITVVKLTLALQGFTLYTRGNIAPTLDEANALAEAHGSLEAREAVLEGRWARCVFDLCQYREGLELAKQHVLLTSISTDAPTRFNSERVLGLSFHFFGDQAGARPFLERVVAHATPLLRPDKPVQIDPQVSAGIGLARVLWLQGLAGRAVTVARQAFERARALDHPVAICYVLAFAQCPLALWSGDQKAAEGFTRLLSDEAARGALDYWSTWARCYELALVGGRSARVGEFLPMQQEMLGTLAGELAHPELVPRCLADVDRWCGPEILRVAASNMMRDGASAVDAEALLQRSLAAARAQKALAWELRSATTLARLWQSRSRFAEAQQLLRPVVETFTIGNETIDLVAARALLARLERSER